MSLDPQTTALVLIDLQRRIVAQPTLSRPGSQVVRNAALLADRFRAVKAAVVLVRVAFSSDWKDSPSTDLMVDSPFQPAQAMFHGDDLVSDLGPRPGDLVITKRQWGAFYGTELDLQLRRRRIGTIVLGGIATNIGVESTARDAFERCYRQIFVEDAMAATTPGAHEMTIRNIFPRIGQVRSTEAVLRELD